ncbi:MAG: hypothetical protein ACJAWC_003245 [Yoonia sp.]|jgi:hypothetical protein
MSYLPEGAMRLPKKSTAMRPVSLTSPFHFNGQTVIGDDEGRLVVTDSHLEMNWLHVLICRRDTANLHEQVAFEWYDTDGECHDHFFDFVVDHTDDKRIGYAVRPLARTGGTFGDTMPRIAKQARASGRFHDVRLLTDKMLNLIELANAWLLHGVRDPEPLVDDAAAKVLSDMVGIETLQCLSDRVGHGGQGFRALVRFIRSHHLCPVQHEKIDLPTQVFKRKQIQ